MEIPHAATALDTARFLVQENRLHEIWFGQLSPAERDVVILDLEAKLSRVRSRALRSHLIGVAQAACFLGLGVVAMAIGPAGFLGAFDRGFGGQTFRSAAAFWALLILFVSLGAFAADYMLRRRHRVTKLWDHESASIRGTIQRGKAYRPPSASSSGSDASATLDDADPVRAAISALREHLHDGRSHYLVERLTEVAQGGPITAEAREALRAASQHVCEECGARPVADALRQWTELHDARTD